MMSKTAVQKDRLPFQFEGAATSFGEGCPPKPKPSYVPVVRYLASKSDVTLKTGLEFV